MDRAYAVLTIKSVGNEEQRTFSGTATTPTPDRMGDIIEPLGVHYTNPLPLLLYHDTERPVGTAAFAMPTVAGIDFTASIPRIAEDGALKSRVDEAWQMVKAGLIRGVSVRVRARKDDIKSLKHGGLHFLKSEVSELSLVTIPANADATIDSIKSHDIGRPAAAGTAADDSTKPKPAVVGATAAVYATTTRAPMPKKTTAEQITVFEATRAAKDAERAGLMEKAADANRTLEADESERYDTLTEEIKGVDEHLVRLHTLEDSNKRAARPVVGDTAEKAASSRSSHDTRIVTVRDNLPPGVRFAQYATCIALAKGNRSEALRIAEGRYPDDGGIQEVLKASVAAGTTTDASWAGNLVQYQNFLADFIEYLRPRSIVDRFGQGNIPSLNRVPFNVRVFGQSSGGAGYWVGEGKPKPLTKFNFTTLTMQWAKVAGIAVLTEEELRFATVNAEMRVRDALAAALVERIDIDFIDPANAGTANVKPPSITNGIAATAPTGTDLDHFQTDFTTAMAGFLTANIPATSLVMIMSASMALQLSMMTNSLNTARAFPDLSTQGGSVYGVPVIVSQYAASYGSPGTNMIILVSANDIYLADDGQVVIDASNEASLEMLDGSLVQDGTAGTGTSLVSLWQSNLLGLRAERFINWKLRRSGVVAYISPAAYIA